MAGSAFGHADIDPIDNDRLRNHAETGDPIGERIIVQGPVLCEIGHPAPNTLVETWQANAGGRYRHKKDIYVAVIDPNSGAAD